MRDALPHARLAKLALDEVERPKIAPKFDEITEGEEVERKERRSSRQAAALAVCVSRRICDHLTTIEAHWE